MTMNKLSAPFVSGLLVVSIGCMGGGGGGSGAAGTNATAGTNGAAGTSVAGTNGAAGTSAAAGSNGAAGTSAARSVLGCSIGRRRRRLAARSATRRCSSVHAYGCVRRRVAGPAGTSEHGGQQDRRRCEATERARASQHAAIVHHASFAPKRAATPGARCGARLARTPGDGRCGRRRGCRSRRGSRAAASIQGRPHRRDRDSGRARAS